MLVGAGLAALSMIAVFFRFGFIYQHSGPELFEPDYYRWAGFGAEVTVPAILFYAMECGLWLCIAMAVRAGLGWARVTGTVLLGVQILVIALYYCWPNSLFVFAGNFAFIGGREANWLTLATFNGLLTILIGITGCAAGALLWLRPSGEYFRTRQHLGLPEARPGRTMGVRRSPASGTAAR